MDSNIVILIFAIINILECHAEISWQERLNLLMRRSLVSAEEPKVYGFRRSLVSAEEPEVYGVRKSLYEQYHPKNIYKINRRLYDFHAGMRSPIIGAPSLPSHLPEAEPILPGHTLLRPSLGMLKSAVKFPHKDLEEGSGVYGNLDNLGITYSGTGERVLYTGFRRRNDDFNEENDRPRFLVAFLHRRRKYEDKPIGRYIDYHKLEQERKIKLEEEERDKQKLSAIGVTPYKEKYHEIINPFTEKENYRQSVNPYTKGQSEAKDRNVKQLLKTLTSNGVTLEFFEIPRLKLEAMQKENYNKSNNNLYKEKYRQFGDSAQGRVGGIKTYARR